MEFVNPAFLYGLAAIVIPVIIHLFNFRRFRKVYFTNVEFIQELKQETQKQSRLKHLVILFLRIMAIIAIVLAFARPFIPVGENLIRSQEQNSVSVYIDNSFSMQSGSSEGTLLQTAQNKAREIAGVYKSSDRFQLLTNDFEGRHQRFVSREEFYDMLDEIEFSAVVRDFSEVFTRQSDLLNFESSKIRSAYVLSDFQSHFLNNLDYHQDTSVNTYFIPMRAELADNLYIDTCWFESPVRQLNQVVKLFLRVRNGSSIAYEDLPVKLNINGTQKALASFDIAPNADKIIELSYTNTQTGIQSGELEINDYPVNFDDRFYFSYYVSPKIRVLSINEDRPSFYLNSLYQNDSLIFFENISVDQLDFSKVENFEFVILNGISTLSSGLAQEAIRFLNAGGSILLFPPAELLDNTYNDLLKSLKIAQFSGLDTTSQRVGEINLDHELYAGVFDDVPDNIDLPLVNKHYIINPRIQSRQTGILQLQNGKPFLSQFGVERGNLYLCAVPLDPEFSGFPRHPVFVPTLYKMAVLSLVSEEIYYVIGIDEMIRIDLAGKSADDVMKIVNDKETFEVIPEHRRVGHMEDLNVHGQIVEAGNYFLEYEKRKIRGLSFNYNRTESILDFNNPDELNTIISDNQLRNINVLDVTGSTFVQALEELSRGIQLWKWFVLAALGFLLAEVLLLRFWEST